MKKPFLMFALTTFIAGALFTFCTSTAEKVENKEENLTEAREEVVEAKKEVAEAEEELAQANEEYIDDMMLCRKETGARTAVNKNRLDEVREKVKKERKEAKADNEKKISELEQENKEMQNRMHEYKGVGKDNWTKFKAEFNHDMDELGKSIEDLGKDNAK
jgi:F0F1-type ATP synthase membrane subunit b/b'